MKTRAKPRYFRDPPLQVFGERVRALRTALGWSQGQLADKADRHWTHVSAIERAERNVTLLSILKLAEAFDVDPGVFLTHDESVVKKTAQELAARPKTPVTRRHL